MDSKNCFPNHRPFSNVDVFDKNPGKVTKLWKDHSIETGSNGSLTQVKESKYLRVLFMRWEYGKMEREIDRWIDTASAVMRKLYRTTVVKRKLNRGDSYHLQLEVFQACTVYWGETPGRPRIHLKDLIWPGNSLTHEELENMVGRREHLDCPTEHDATTDPTMKKQLNMDG